MYTSHTNHGVAVLIINAETRKQADRYALGRVWPDADVEEIDLTTEGVVAEAYGD